MHLGVTIGIIVAMDNNLPSYHQNNPTPPAQETPMSSNPSQKEASGFWQIAIILILIGAISAFIYFRYMRTSDKDEPTPTPILSEEEANLLSETPGPSPESATLGDSTSPSATPKADDNKGGVTATPTPKPTEKPVTRDNTDGWDIVRVTSHGITFKHPDMDYNCCGIQGPVTGVLSKIIVLADKSTVTEGTTSPFDGLAMYTIYDEDGLDFDGFMKNEKEELLKEYEKVTGRKSENYKEEGINIAGKSGIKLTGYAYFGDVYYLDFDDKRILFIAKTEKSDGSFDAAFDKILSTISFN